MCGRAWVRAYDRGARAMTVVTIEVGLLCATGYRG